MGARGVGRSGDGASVRCLPCCHRRVSCQSLASIESLNRRFGERGQILHDLRGASESGGFFLVSLGKNFGGGSFRMV